MNPDVQRFYDDLAETYDRRRFSSPYDRCVDAREKQFVLSRIAAEARVLEIGPGTGRFTELLVGKAASVTAVDASAGMLEQLRAKVGSPKLDARAMDLFEIERLPLYGAFDTVVCMRVLPHLADPRPALAKIRNAVRPAGNCIFDLWNRLSFVGLARLALGRGSRVLTRYYTYGRMLQMIGAAGLSTRASLAWGYPRVGRFSLDRPGNLLLKRFGYSVLFDASPCGQADPQAAPTRRDENN